VCGTEREWREKYIERVKYTSNRCCKTYASYPVGVKGESSVTSDIGATLMISTQCNTARI